MFEIKKPIKARLEHHQNKLRIVVTFPDDKRKTIATGLSDDPVNRTIVQRMVSQIILDDKLGQFDHTLNKYKPKHSGRGGSLILVSNRF